MMRTDIFQTAFRWKLIAALSFVICHLSFIPAGAQPQSRRDAQQQKPKSNADNMTTRARISFPVQAQMSEDVVWRRDIYRELSLEEKDNAGLYYPPEPVGNEMNLFTYMFKLMMRGPKNGGIPAYEYRIDGQEVFNDSARIKPLQFLDNYHIYYERVNGRVRLDNSDIPSREVKGYYIKESAYYDQANSTFHTKVVALCPIMSREDDFGDGATKYPLFWVLYDDLAPFLSKQTIMTSDINNAATMSLDDFFTKNHYRGKIYKTTNMLGKTLAQYCENDSAMSREQQRIEQELIDFEKSLFGDQERKDSLDSLANLANQKTKKVKSARRTRRSAGSEAGQKAVAAEEKATPEPKARAKRHTSTPSSSPSSGARVSVRRQRH